MTDREILKSISNGVAYIGFIVTLILISGCAGCFHA